MADLSQLELILQYTFQHRELLVLALTHRSSQVRPGQAHNEKLEFLGDAVLGLAMSDLLMARFLEASEGDLSKMRASLPRNPSQYHSGNGCASVAAKNAAADAKSLLFWRQPMRPCWALFISMGGSLPRTHSWRGISRRTWKRNHASVRLIVRHACKKLRK